jgi:hypothetical protein
VGVKVVKEGREGGEMERARNVMKIGTKGGEER